MIRVDEGTCSLQAAVHEQEQSKDTLSSNTELDLSDLNPFKNETEDIPVSGHAVEILEINDTTKEVITENHNRIVKEECYDFLISSEVVGNNVCPDETESDGQTQPPSVNPFDGLDESNVSNNNEIILENTLVLEETPVSSVHPNDQNRGTVQHTYTTFLTQQFHAAEDSNPFTSAQDVSSPVENIQNIPEDEHNIQNLARVLADKLRRENLTPSAFSFEEFEREQEEMRMQHYIHHQEVFHQQQQYREEYLRHRPTLSIQVTESPHYSALPSPGNPLMHPTAEQQQAPWYYADEVSMFENSMGTPCSRRDRLYEALPYQYQAQEFTRDKYDPKFSHQPTLIGKAALRQVEHSREDFFQRLYDIRLHHYAHKVQAMQQVSIATAQVVNTVHPRVLTEEQRAQVSDRLINHKNYTTNKFHAQRVEFSQQLRTQQKASHVRPRSDRIVTSVHRKALGEIFEVLLVTAQLERDRCIKRAQLEKQSSMEETVREEEMTEAEQPNTDAEAVVSIEEGMLDTALAGASYLQPKQLADAIAVVLASLSPRIVTRDQFVEFTLHCMHKTSDMQLQLQEDQEAEQAGLDLSTEMPMQTPCATADAAMTPSAAEDEVAVEVSPSCMAPASEPVSVPTTTTKPQSTPCAAHTPSRMLRQTPQATPASARRTPNQSNRGTPGSVRSSSSVPGTPASVVIPPIGYLLVASKTGGRSTSSQKERRQGTQAQREYNTHFTGKPQLVAQKTTEKLVKKRYAERSAGKQSIEDSLISYMEVKRNNNLERSLQLDEKNRRDCTFQPNINSPYMVRYKSAGRPVTPNKNVNAMLRSSSRTRSRPTAAVDEDSSCLSNPTTIDAEGREETPRSPAPSPSARPATPPRVPPHSGAPMGWSSVESSPGLRATTARPGSAQYISTSPEILMLGPDGQAVPVPVRGERVLLDQREYLGYGRVRATTPTGSRQLRRAASDSRMPAPGPMRQMYPDFSTDHSVEYRRTHLTSPSSAMYLQRTRPPPTVAAAPGRFSYDRNSSFSSMRSPSYTALYTSKSNVGTPRSSRSPGRFFPPAASPRTPTTASTAEYKLSQDALHRQMYQELYYNTP